MAIVSDQKLRKSFSGERRLLMLKDYLLDDLSSCSSSGFKSFPRRQCCTTIRFLLEVDLNTKHSHSQKYNAKPSVLRRSRSKATSTTISALHKASEVLRNAVKQIPFPTVKSPTPSSTQQKRKKGLLPRSFSRKLLKRSFWRKAADKEEHTIKRWKVFQEFLEEKHQPSNENFHQSSTTTLTSHRVSTSASSKSNSASWTESDFAILRSTSRNSEISTLNDVEDSKAKRVISSRVGVIVGGDSITNCGEDNTKEWPIEEEKEQFSPVSVLDCPFEDDKDSSSPSSPFQNRLARMEGTKQKLMQKIRCFETLAHLEPLDLEKRIAFSELEDETGESPLQSCSLFDDETEKKVSKLLKEVRSSPQSDNLVCKAENLLSDFFREKTEEENAKVDWKELLKVAQNWINGESQELLMGWEVESGRKVYVKEMEKNGRFRNAEEEKEEVGLDLEVQIFTTLVNELVLDIFMQRSCQLC